MMVKTFDALSSDFAAFDLPAQNCGMPQTGYRQGNDGDLNSGDAAE
jgi:hypothetical protein